MAMPWATRFCASSAACLPRRGTGSTIAFSLWARNLLDEEHLFYKLNSSALGQTGIFNDPRTYGFDVTVNF